MAEEGKIKELEDANLNNRRIQELERKSEQDDEEIRYLREDIEKERRKSTADENTIKRLEYLLAEKLKTIEGEKARNTETKKLSNL